MSDDVQKNVKNCEDFVEEPWNHMSHKWSTQSKYFQYLRGSFRRIWNKSPIKIEFMHETRIKVPNPNPKGRVPEVWGYECNCCGKQDIAKNFQVDHKLDAGSLRCWGDVERFVRRLLACKKSDLQMLCVPCHEIKSYQEKHGLTWKQAVIGKKVSKANALKVGELKQFLDEQRVPWEDGDKKSVLINRYRLWLEENYNDDSEQN